jgi:general secretion pathway protein G
VHDSSRPKIELKLGDPVVLEYVNPGTSRQERQRSIERLTRWSKSLLMVLLCVFLGTILIVYFAGEVEQRERGNRARISGAEVDLANLSTVLSNFEQDCGRYPSTADGLQALLARPSWAKNWYGPYVEAIALKDPWERTFIYRCPGTIHPGGFDLISLGPDGVEGTSDDIQNVGRAGRGK